MYDRKPVLSYHFQQLATVTLLCPGTIIRLLVYGTSQPHVLSRIYILYQKIKTIHGRDEYVLRYHESAWDGTKLE